jgi:phosphoglycerate dehydrogenase-like enzyme
MTQDTLHVTVAGIPRSYQSPNPDGRWLTEGNIAQIIGVSPQINLTHITESALTAGGLPPAPPNVLLIEASGEEPCFDEISAANLAKLVTPHLKWVQSCSSGVGHILDLGLLNDDVTLTNAAGVHAGALAESIMAAILFHAKRLSERLDNQRQRNWQELHCSEISGQTLAIIGTGKIGSEAARLAKAFGMNTLGINRSGRTVPNFDDISGPDKLLDTLARADFIVIACPLTAETKGMIGPLEFSRMKTNAYLINIARGKITNELALLKAVMSGQISGAFLDALAEEPLSPDHPFWVTPGVTIIPHDSHSSPRIGDNIVDIFSDNLRRYLSGEPLVNLVDRNQGY